MVLVGVAEPVKVFVGVERMVTGVQVEVEEKFFVGLQVMVKVEVGDPVGV